MEKNDNAPKAIAKIKFVPTKKIDGIEEKIGKNLFEIFTDVNTEDLKLIVKSLEIVERAAVYSKHGESLDKCKKISNERNYNMAIYTLESLVSNYNKTLYETLNITKEELLNKLTDFSLEEKRIFYKVHGIDFNKTMPAEKILDKQSLRKYTRLLSKLNSKPTRRKINESKTDKVEEEIIEITDKKIEQKTELIEEKKIEKENIIVEEKQQCLNEEFFNISLNELYKKINIVILKFMVESQPMYLREIIYDTYGNDLDKIMIDFSTMNHQELNLLKEALYNLDKLVKLYNQIEEEYKINNTDMVIMDKDYDFKILGSTLDDSIGEVYDKVATNNKKKKKKKKKVVAPQMLSGDLETYRITFLDNKYNKYYGFCQ